MKVKQLLGENVLIQPDPKEEKVGSIYIPDTNQKKAETGTVIAVGTGRVLDNGQKVPLDVNAGDKVIFGKFAEEQVTVDMGGQIIVKEKNILAVL